MTDPTPSPLDSLLTRLHAEPSEYADHREPHPKADVLFLPDKSLAPASLRAWASFDNRYPTYLSVRRSELAIADARGKVIATPMKKILKDVCLDSIIEELEGDDETIAALKVSIRDHAKDLTGYGVLLDPYETPDRILWFGSSDEPTVIWYEHDAFDRREPFSQWVASLF